MKVKYINDYVDLVSEEFPELTRDEVKKIGTYCFRMMIEYVRSNNDIYIRNHGFFFFVGHIASTAFGMYKKYLFKLPKRIRLMFRKTNSEWDGCYYFGRTENQYIEYLKLNKKKYKIFKNVVLYKVLEEAKVACASSPYIFRLTDDKTEWFKKYYPEIKTDKAELIIHRDPLNMLDIMVSNNKYKYISK